jgi:formate hydrogenlyase transcriptional activator
MHMGSQNTVLSREYHFAGLGFACNEDLKPEIAPPRVQYEKSALNNYRFKDEPLVLDHKFDGIIGSSAPLMEVLDLVQVVAPTDSTVLIEGETGTGKELIARAIHKQSNRSQRAFVSVNCAALAPSLIASELFGHEKGAFTGAMQQRLGRFELANGGTIFLDEVGELPPDTQVALLRVLQEREFERVGGMRSIRVDVRVIAATNRDLESAVANGTFRSDLFYRLNVFPIEVPPLRKRKEDIPVLIEHFVKCFAEKVGRQFSQIGGRTLDLCQTYHWPGNIRELQNIVERSVIRRSGDTFWVDEAALSSHPSPWPDSPLRPRQTLHGNENERGSHGERKIIGDALRETRGRVYGPRGAALKLRIPPSTLESRIKALNICKKQFKFS